MADWATPSGIAVGVSSVAALHLWIGAMLLLRGRLGKYHTDNPEMERQHSEYHNSSVYRDFSFSVSALVNAKKAKTTGSWEPRPGYRVRLKPKPPSVKAML